MTSARIHAPYFPRCFSLNQVAGSRIYWDNMQNVWSHAKFVHLARSWQYGAC